MAYDKKLHLACGFLICLLGCLVNVDYGLPLTILAGASKELYDYFHRDKHSVEFLDFAYTCLGGTICNIAFLLLA